MKPIMQALTHIRSSKRWVVTGLLTLALGACTLQPPAAQEGKSNGCPTPIVVSGVDLTGEQASNGPAGIDDVTQSAGATEQLSPAEREALLDQVNQGPARPDAPDGADLSPIPGTESSQDTALAPNIEPTPTPCQ